MINHTNLQEYGSEMCVPWISGSHLKEVEKWERQYDILLSFQVVVSSIFTANLQDNGHKTYVLYTSGSPLRA
jgi:hypothetical protein